MTNMNLVKRNPIDDNQQCVCVLPWWLFHILSWVGLVQWPCCTRYCKLLYRKWYHPEDKSGKMWCKYIMEDMDDTCRVEYKTPIDIPEKVKEVLVVIHPIKD